MALSVVPLRRKNQSLLGRCGHWLTGARSASVTDDPKRTCQLNHSICNAQVSQPDNLKVFLLILLSTTRHAPVFIHRKAVPSRSNFSDVG
jgi:hypothetical protein